MLLQKLADVLLPRYCRGCDGRLTGSEKDLCLHCLIKLPRTELWLNPEENVLAKNFWGRTGRTEVNKVAAFLAYGKTTTTGRIVHAFKYRGDKRLAYDMGCLMAQELRDTGFFENIDCLIPVPLTLWRRLRRGYNQAECLARGIGKETGLPVYAGILGRRRFRMSQTVLTVRERSKNVAGSFFVRQKRVDFLKGKHLLLIDDVITTGATTRECVRQLAIIPEVKVSVLAFSTVQSAEMRVELTNKIKNKNNIENEESN